MKDENFTQQQVKIAQMKNAIESLTDHVLLMEYVSKKKKIEFDAYIKAGFSEQQAMFLIDGK